MENQGLTIIDYSVVAAFFVVMVGVGVYFSRRKQDVGAFFGSDKSVPWWLSGISFYMNSFSAQAFVMYSALAYKLGWVPVTVSWLSVPAVLLGARFLAVRWRRAAKGSPIDFIATRYTPGMCKSLAWLGLPMQLLDNALKLLAIGTVVGVGMGFPLFWSICISGLIIVLYTFLGGLKATLVCDFIQFFVILAVVFTLPFLCLGKIGGFTGFIEKAPTGFFSFTGGEYDWPYMIVFFLMVGSTLSTNWSLVQRYYSTKSDKDAKKMAYLVSALLFLGPPLFFFPAMAARLFLPDLDMADGQTMNGVYALLCRAVLPVGMMGMVIAAMFSATMSSLAGNFNAAASVLVNEIYGRFVKHDSPGKRMIAARAATVFVGVAVIGLTFVMQSAQGNQDLFNLTNKMFSVFLPPIAIPMLVGVFSKRLSKRAGLCGLVGGMAFGLAMFVAGAWWPVLREMKPCYLATAAATILCLVLGSVFFKDTPEERKDVEDFVGRLSA